MAKIKVESEYLKVHFGHGLDYGYLTVPNLLLDHGRDLGLKDFDVYFIIQILRAQQKSRTSIIKDDDLPIDSCGKTLQRFRKKLSEIKDENGNNLVTINSFYTQTPDGKYKGHGTEYDFRKLYDYLIDKYEEKPKGLSVPTGGSPNGLVVQADPEKGSPTGLPVPAIEDPESDMYKELENKNYKNLPSGEIIFADDSWTYYSDETASYMGEERISIRTRMSLPPQVQSWLDAKYTQTQQQGKARR